MIPAFMRWAPAAQCDTGEEIARFDTVRGTHWLSCAAISFARGLNDTPKIVAVLFVATMVAAKLDYLFAALAIAAGGILAATRVAWTISKKITPMAPSEAVTANLVSAALILLASLRALPVSATHITSGSIFGIGLLRRREADWGRVRDILLSWIATLPLAAAFGMMSYQLLVRWRFQVALLVRAARVDSPLWLTIIGNAFMRIASGASGVLVGLYLAGLADRGFGVRTALVGTLGAVSFASELAAGVPMGVASDALAPRTLMTTGALLGALATQLFGISSQPAIFFVSRTVEGLGAASVTPSLLAHLTDTTDRSHSLRARVMSYFELSLLAGLALGGVLAAQLWRRLHTAAFAAVASVYLASGGMLFWGQPSERDRKI